MTVKHDVLYDFTIFSGSVDSLGLSLIVHLTKNLNTIFRGPFSHKNPKQNSRIISKTFMALI